MRRKLIVGNWKMHGSQQQVRQLLQDMESKAGELSEDVEIGVCPTYVHIADLVAARSSDRIMLGAQNVHAEPEGAFTGEVSAPMLADYGLHFVIVGHSERREIFGESDQLISEKFIAVQKSKMVPILCVGETLLQREAGETEEVVLRQLDVVIDAAGIEAFADSVLAYEPVWAIGTGKTASPEQAQQAHKVLREHLAKQSPDIAGAVRILYGGSVKSANSDELFAQADIDGGLVGGASLQAEEFISICKSAD